MRATPWTVLALLALAMPARAQVLRADGQTQNIACQGGDALIEGSGNTVTLTGGCRSLTLRGNGDTVSVPIAPAGRILVEGNGDSVRYRALGAPPLITLRGAGSTVAGADGKVATPAAPPPPPPGEVRGDRLDRSVDCAGAAASLQGSYNRIGFTGACRGLDLRGNDDDVLVDLAAGARITVAGNRNTVRYHAPPGGPPTISVDGAHSAVTDATAPAAVAPAKSPPPPRAVPPPPLHYPPLVLAGDAQTAEAACAGRSVQVLGNGGHYTLHGGCPSLAIQGDDATVTAELAPHAVLTVQGRNDHVTWTAPQGASQPTTWIKGEGSTVAASPAP